jgi:hypothetical protein
MTDTTLSRHQAGRNLAVQRTWRAVTCYCLVEGAAAPLPDHDWSPAIGDGECACRVITCRSAWTAEFAVIVDPIVGAVLLFGLWAALTAVQR